MIPVAELKSILGPRHVLTDPADLVSYSYDGTWQQALPTVVCLPGSTSEVAAVMRLASKHRIPVTPRGAGTGLAGGAVPVRGGIVLALTRMNRILRIDGENMLAEVEPGVSTAHLQEEVERAGLYYPPDPSSRIVCTIGGNIATNAGGARCLKYGVTRDYLLGLEVVLASGDVLTTGGQTVKNVTGYDLTRLFCGSEGTLGIVTRATLRLVPKPEHHQLILAVFADLDSAARAVPGLIRTQPATLEFIDETTLQVVQQHVNLELPDRARTLLLIEVDGYREAVERQAREVRTTLENAGAVEIRTAASPQEEAKFWTARRSISPALARLKPAKLGEDVAVPPTRIAEFIRGFQYLREQYGLTMVIFGHAGDGNLHPNVLFDPTDTQEVARANAMLGELARLALGLGGTLSGEHGIGSLKAPFIEWELGSVGMTVMRAVKRALDPDQILNPGKMRLDDDEGGGGVGGDIAPEESPAG